MASPTSDVKTLWQEFHQRLRRFILQRVNNPVDADDILQEVFVRIHQHLTTIRDCDRLQSWIFQIAQELGISVSGMKSRVQRGRQKLKQLLQTCCQIELDAVGNAIECEMKDRRMCSSCGLTE